MIRNTEQDMVMTKHILIVEDDSYLRDLYLEVLKEAGFDVAIATDGEVGLSKLQSGNYDLVLLDMMMPKMDGLQLLTYLHDHPIADFTGFIILLTNMAHDPVLQKGMDLGAKGYIIKSEITPDVFLERVKQFLAH